MREYLYLGAAIAMEVTGTTALKFSDEFTKLVPSAVVIVGYLASFYFVSLTLDELPIGLVYGTWAAVGILAIAVIGVFLFDEPVDVPGAIGMLLIVVGVVLLNVFSDTYSPAH